MPVKTRKAAVLSCVALAATRSCAFIPPGGSTAALTSNPTRVTPRGSPCSTCSYVVAGMFGRGGGGRASIGASTGSRARKTLESSTVFIARTEQVEFRVHGKISTIVTTTIYTSTCYNVRCSASDSVNTQLAVGVLRMLYSSEGRHICQ